MKIQVTYKRIFDSEDYFDETVPLNRYELEEILRDEILDDIDLCDPEWTIEKTVRCDTKVRLKDETPIYIVDGNDSEDIDPEDELGFENINYYLCPIEYTNEECWSDYYVFARRCEFELV